MNRNILLIAIVAAGLFGGSAGAQEYGPARWFRHDDNDERVEGFRWGLRRDVDRINRMLSHVRYQMQRYNASRRQWSMYRAAEADVNQVNYLFRHGGDRDRISNRIDRARDRLDRIQRELRLRSRDYFRW